MLHVETLIVGGGLSGLSLARLLNRASLPFALIEARDRLGGRIDGHHENGATFDLGPAWFWPGQPRIAALVDALGLSAFEQFSAGLAVYEDEQAHRQTAHGFASMAGSFRVEGGFSKLINSVNADLPQARLHTNEALKSLRFDGEKITVITSKRQLTSERVVLAVPPRVISQTIDIEGFNAFEALRSAPTWMAGHAKAVAIYKEPFWRAAGLSGDAISRIGPLMEIHDASPNDAKSGALFGFIGTPVQKRQNQPDLRQAIKSQLGRMFGPAAENPTKLVIKDWAFEPCTATDLDHSPLYEHPKYQLPQALKGHFDNRLFFASTEVAPEFGGYLEGALEAAEQTFAKLNRGL